jgi:hypothetical protein
VSLPSWTEMVCLCGVIARPTLYAELQTLDSSLRRTDAKSSEMRGRRPKSTRLSALSRAG